jgi:hypothetical protein
MASILEPSKTVSTLSFPFFPFFFALLLRSGGIDRRRTHPPNPYRLTWVGGQSFFPAMTKIVGTLGPKSRSVDTISACLKAGMSVARFDFSWGDAAYHQETLHNLKLAIKSTKKLCAVSDALLLDPSRSTLLLVTCPKQSSC